MLWQRETQLCDSAVHSAHKSFVHTHTHAAPHHDSNLDDNPLSSSCAGSGTWSVYKQHRYCATECVMNGAQLVSCEGWSAGGVLDLQGLGIDHLSRSMLVGLATQPTAMYVRCGRCQCR